MDETTHSLFVAAEEELENLPQDLGLEFGSEQLGEVENPEQVQALFSLAKQEIEDPESVAKLSDQIKHSEGKEIHSQALMRQLEKAEKLVEAPVFSLKGNISEEERQHRKEAAKLPEFFATPLNKRVSAFMIDFCAALVVSLLLAALFLLPSDLRSVMLSSDILRSNEALPVYGTLLATFICVLTFMPLVIYSLTKSTPGTEAMRLKLIKDNGRDVAVLNVFVRFLCMPASLVLLGFLPLFIGKRPLHDALARVYLVQQP